MKKYINITHQNHFQKRRHLWEKSREAEYSCTSFTGMFLLLVFIFTPASNLFCHFLNGKKHYQNTKYSLSFKWIYVNFLKAKNENSTNLLEKNILFKDFSPVTVFRSILYEQVDLSYEFTFLFYLEFLKLHREWELKSLQTSMSQKKQFSK